MASNPRPTLWSRISDLFPPASPPQVSPLMIHTSGKLVGRKGMPDESAGQRRWLNWVAAIITAIGVMLLLTKMAWGDSPVRRTAPATMSASR